MVVGAGTILFEEGTLGDIMYVVLDGELEISVRGELIATLGKGEIAGEMALIEAKPRSASAVARTDSRLVPVDVNRFVSLTRQAPEFALHIMTVLAGRLRQMDMNVQGYDDED